VKKFVTKSDESIQRIEAKLKTNFLLSHLDDEGRKDLTDAVVEVAFPKGAIIIKQVSGFLELGLKFSLCMLKLVWHYFLKQV
jgi:hypothetical protein